jgi:hypothetical protein
MNLLYKVRKKSVNSKATFMVTKNKWDSKGKFFTADQLLKMLRKEFDSTSSDQKLPPDWEIVEYQLIETKETPADTFIKYKSKTPWVKGT